MAKHLLKPDVTTWISCADSLTRVFLATDTPARYYQLDQVKKQFQLTRKGILLEVMRD